MRPMLKELSSWLQVQVIVYIWLFVLINMEILDVMMEAPEQRLYIHIEDPENEKVYFGFSQFVTSGHYPSYGKKNECIYSN